MLVLSRKIGEEIIVNDNVRIRVLSVQGQQIRLGLIAPLDVSIHRREILADSNVSSNHDLIKAKH